MTNTEKLMPKILGGGCLSSPYNCSFMKIKHRTKSWWKLLLNKFTQLFSLPSVHILHILKVITRTSSFKPLSATELGDLPS